MNRPLDCLYLPSHVMPGQCKSVDELPLIVPEIIEPWLSFMGIFYKAITFPMKEKALEGLITIFTCVEF